MADTSQTAFANSAASPLKMVDLGDSTFALAVSSVDMAGTHIEASTTAAAASQSPALAAAAAKTTYITGFAVTGGGATAASVIRITVDGTATQLNYDLGIPAGATLGVTPLIVTFSRPIPASAVNSAITLNVPSFGAGNTIAAAAVYGYQR